MAGIRDKGALARLPMEEQKAFTQLWAYVAALHKKAERKANRCVDLGVPPERHGRSNIRYLRAAVRHPAVDETGVCNVARIVAFGGADRRAQRPSACLHTSRRRKRAAPPLSYPHRSYLRDVLRRLPSLPASRLDDLLPGRWAHGPVGGCG